MCHFFFFPHDAIEPGIVNLLYLHYRPIEHRLWSQVHFVLQIRQPVQKLVRLYFDALERSRLAARRLACRDERVAGKFHSLHHTLYIGGQTGFIAVVIGQFSRPFRQCRIFHSGFGPVFGIAIGPHLIEGRTVGGGEEKKDSTEQRCHFPNSCSIMRARCRAQEILHPETCRMPRRETAGRLRVRACCDVVYRA